LFSPFLSLLFALNLNSSLCLQPWLCINQCSLTRQGRCLGEVTRGWKVGWVLVITIIGEVVYHAVWVAWDVRCLGIRPLFTHGCHVPVKHLGE
jgi:hypothetical protein